MMRADCFAEELRQVVMFTMNRPVLIFSWLGFL